MSISVEIINNHFKTRDEINAFSINSPKIPSLSFSFSPELSKTELEVRISPILEHVIKHPVRRPGT